MYTWSGPEEPLGTPVCVATSLHIEEIVDTPDGGKLAKGKIWFMDYMENCQGDDRWEAVGEKTPEGSLSWTVRPVQDQIFFRNGDTKQPMFTADRAIDRGIEAFIKTHLTLALEPPKEPAPKKPQLAAFQHQGECICEELLRHPRSFEEMCPGAENTLTNCFTCSCGRNWWHPAGNQYHWVPVPDSAAWSMLLENHGEPVRAIGVIETGVHLLQTLRNQGLVPLG